MDKVFGWWRREGQEGQATQRQSTDSPACQGKILSKRFPRDFLAANPEPSENLKLAFDSFLPENFSKHNRVSLSSLEFLNTFSPLRNCFSRTAKKRAVPRHCALNVLKSR